MATTTTETTELVQEEREVKQQDQEPPSEQPETQKEKEKETVRRFVSGLSPFISALEEFDGTSEPEEASDGSVTATTLMRPIRELIYKSFTNPSEGEEGVIYVMNELELLKKYCNGDTHSILNDDLVIRSIGHFLSLTLPPSWIDSMCRWMIDRMQLILLKFFTFKHYCSCYFNADIANSRLFVLQCALHRRFPLLISEGCASLSRCPVFYGTKQCSLFSDNNFIRCSWQLLQTGASFKVIPLHRHRSRKKKDALSITPLTMDLRTLEQEIERDQSKGRLPCVVIASSTDNLQKIRSICDRHGLWLHIEGAHASSSSLLLAAATTLPKHTRIMMQCADSISCQPFKWFTNNDVNNRKYKYKRNLKPQIIRNAKSNKYKVVSNYKTNRFGNDIPGCSSTLTFIKEDLRDTPPPSITYSDSDFVMMFPLWHLLVTCSIKQIKNRVDHSLNLCQYLHEQLVERKNIFTTALLFKASTVIFQITPNINIIDLSAFKLDINTFHELLINRCCKEMNKLQMEWKLYDDHGMEEDEEEDEDKNKSNDDAYADDNDNNITPYFRFEPLVKDAAIIKHEYIAQFIQTIVVEINILRKCLELRRVFQDYISRDDDLEFVDAMTVQSINIGLGAFRFVPSFFKNNTESAAESVHILNKCLCDELNERNGDRMTQMFKLSNDLNGIVCIVINPTNMVFEENCIETIYTQIYECHKKMKYPQQVMEVMAQAIKSGIDNAQKVVQDQASADYSVDSIVRKVPLFGSVYGWLLPDYHSNDTDDLLDNTGVGFQIGVGMTKPQIQRPMHNQEDQTDNENDNGNDNDDNI
eukprot:208523_1